MSTTKPRCRHRNVWVFKGSPSSPKLLWCYQCGAIRNGDKKWVKPTGIGGPNPAMLEGR